MDSSFWALRLQAAEDRQVPVELVAALAVAQVEGPVQVEALLVAQELLFGISFFLLYLCRPK